MIRKYIIVADDSIKGFDEEIAKLEREWGAEEIEPSEDCISREEVRRILANEVFELMKLHTVNPEDNPKADAMSYGVNWSLNTLMELPSVTPTSEDIKEAYLKGYDYGVKDWFKSKTQPCEDCINRQAVIEGLANIAKAKAKSDAQKTMMGRCMFFVEQLPSVTPERPKGKWIEYKVDIAPHPLHCSLCSFSNHHISNRYMKEFRRCPNCGAEMSGGEEDDDNINH